MTVAVHAATRTITPRTDKTTESPTEAAKDAAASTAKLISQRG